MQISGRACATGTLVSPSRGVQLGKSRDKELRCCCTRCCGCSVSLSQLSWLCPRSASFPPRPGTQGKPVGARCCSHPHSHSASLPGRGVGGRDHIEGSSKSRGTSVPVLDCCRKQDKWCSCLALLLCTDQAVPHVCRSLGRGSAAGRRL